MAIQRLECFGRCGQVGSRIVYSRNADKAAEISNKYAVETCCDYEQFIDMVDSVVVCVPNCFHFEYAVAALAKAKHVMVEYPLVVDSGEFEQLKRLSEQAGVVLMTGNTIIHESPYIFTAENIGKLGRMVSCSSRVAFYSDEIAGAWFMDRAITGSVFAAMNYHHIEYYKRLLGPVVKVWAVDQSSPCDGIKNIAGGNIFMEHKNKVTSSIQWYLSDKGAGLPRSMVLNGTCGSLTLITLVNGKTSVVWGESIMPQQEITDQWGVQGSCEDFIKAVNGQIDHRLLLADDNETLKIAWAAEHSSVSGRLVEI